MLVPEYLRSLDRCLVGFAGAVGLKIIPAVLEGNSSLPFELLVIPLGNLCMCKPTNC